MKEFSKEETDRMSAGGLVPPGTPVRMLHIGAPRIERSEGFAYLTCDISLGDIKKTVYFKTEAKYGKYLCYERSDAYLIGLLNFAMRERCDIECEAPVTTELLHQIQTELVPALTTYDKLLYAPVIAATPTASSLPSAGKVATGCSCGIDSMYAIKTLSENACDYIKVDYVVINNVGAYTTQQGTSQARYISNVENAQAFAKTNAYELIITDSNIADAFPQNHFLTHLYSSCFAIHALRKLWNRYYYASSGIDIEHYFNLTNNHAEGAARYDLIALPAFSIPDLRICNQGLHVVRFEKTKAIADYEPAWHYLNVCLRQGKGACNECSKCLRTLWTLDAMGKLDNFKEIFDVSNYRNNYSRYMKLLYLAHLNGVHMIDEAYEILKGRITPAIRREAKRDWARQNPSRLRKLARKAKRLAKQLLGRD